MLISNKKNSQGKSTIPRNLEWNALIDSAPPSELFPQALHQIADSRGIECFRDGNLTSAILADVVYTHRYHVRIIRIACNSGAIYRLISGKPAFNSSKKTAFITELQSAGISSKLDCEWIYDTFVNFSRGAYYPATNPIKRVKKFKIRLFRSTKKFRNTLAQPKADRLVLRDKKLDFDIKDKRTLSGFIFHYPMLVMTIFYAAILLPMMYIAYNLRATNTVDNSNNFRSEPRLPDNPKPPENTFNQLKIPDGMYIAERGWGAAIGKLECVSQYPDISVLVENGEISFTQGKLEWSGTIDQKTKEINMTAFGGKYMISGTTDEAIMSGWQRCENGFFRFK